MRATDTASSPPRCALVWTLVLSLLAVLVLAIALPWMQALGRFDEALASRTDQLVRYQRLAATRPRLDAELAAVRANDDFKAFYFSAPTAALAGAALQRQVQQIVTSAGGRLVSTQILPEARGEHAAQVRVRTQIQGSTETLLEVLDAIEQARPFLFIEQVSVRSSARSSVFGGRPARRTPRRTNGKLTVRLDLFGFTLEGGA